MDHLLLMPEQGGTQLEFDKILEDVAGRCLGKPASNSILGSIPSIDPEYIQSELLKVDEMKIILSVDKIIPIRNYLDLKEAFQYLEVQEFVLDMDAILQIREQLMIAKDLIHFFEKKAEKLIAWGPVIVQFGNPDEVLNNFNSIFDEEGEILDTASQELARVRKNIRTNNRRLENAFEQSIQKYLKAGYLAETHETIRNGRRVLTVGTEHKRKIRGIIHDESATGKTTYIEPEEVILLNNEWFDLRQEEKRAIHKILQALCNTLSEQLPYLKNVHSALIHIDSITARAKMALEIEGVRPEVNDLSIVKIRNGYHPLLKLKNQKERKRTIPFSLELHPDQRIIIISGPNAGGKTVTIKSLGLLQMMLQNGMLIPVDQDSSFCIFKRICVDIGDHQSLERDLSTYASHLRSMKIFLDNIDHDSLILIDEFGSGTDPKLGGALAESILMAMNRKGVYGAITTHYSNLKVLAQKTRGITNGSLSFDRELLEPSYRFQLGLPGSSYAFEMAARSGFDPKIVQQARKNAGVKEEKLEDLLNQLQEEKLTLDEKLISITKKEKDLDRLIKNYERLHLEHEIKRKKLRREEKAQSLHKQARLNKELEKTIQRIREIEKMEEAKEMAARVKEEKSNLTKEIEALDQAMQIQKAYSQRQKKYAVGDFVRIKLGGFVGKISEIRKNKVKIMSDHMVVNAELKDLEPIEKPINRNPMKSIHVDLLSKSEVFRKIDIRGLKKEDARLRLEKFFDNALMANLHSLEVIHGKGDGVLRELVREKLQDYSVDFEIIHPEPESGGEGVSIVHIK